MDEWYESRCFHTTHLGSVMAFSHADNRILQAIRELLTVGLNPFLEGIASWDTGLTKSCMQCRATGLNTGKKLISPCLGGDLSIRCLSRLRLLLHSWSFEYSRNWEIYCSTMGPQQATSEPLAEWPNWFPRLSLITRKVFFLASHYSRTVLTW